MEHQVKQAEKHAEGAGRDTPRERVYQAIRDLSLELHPAWNRTLVVRPGYDLDRELGYDSLARVELLLRLNRAFGIALPDQLIVEAATAGDIWEAVAAAAPQVARGAPEALLTTALPEAPAPEDAATLVDVLAAHVRAQSEPDTRPPVAKRAGGGGAHLRRARPRRADARAGALSPPASSAATAWRSCCRRA